MTLGDLVLVNSFMIQLYIPLNFLGVIYREIKQSLADMERLFALLEQNREVADAPDAQAAGTRTARRSSSRTSISATTRSARSCSTSTSPSRPAPPPPWSATAARASRPCRACCSASTTCSRARITHRRPGPAQRDPGLAAPRDRHRAAGYGAVQRHHRIQHRLRPPGRQRARTSWRRRARPPSTTSSRACRTAMRQWWASAA